MGYVAVINNLEIPIESISVNYVVDGHINNRIFLTLLDQQTLDLVLNHMNDLVGQNINGIIVYDDDENELWNLNYVFTVDSINSGLTTVQTNREPVYTDTPTHQVILYTTWTSLSS